MREEKKHLTLSPDEQNILIRVLNDMRNIYKEEGITTDAVDELILKIADARDKRMRVAEIDAYERS